MVSKKCAHLWLYGAATLLMAFLFLFGQERISKYINGDNAGKITVEQLRQAFNILPLHNDDQFGKTEFFDKESIVGVTNHATSMASPEELLRYYSDNLKAGGWKQRNLIARDDGGKKIRFCKNRMSLTLDASPLPNGSRYYVGIIWTRYRMSADYCGELSPKK
jgi:hypothetical protein